MRRQRERLPRVLVEQAGNRCAFPDCEHDQYLQIAAIRAMSPGGPRYDPEVPTGPGSANFIILCASHHRLIDAEPHRFSVAILQEMRREQLACVQPAGDISHRPGSQEQSGGSAMTTLRDALVAWNERPEDADEDYWHRLFEDVPQVLAAAVPGSAMQLGSKCYVGGKSITNRHGSIVDFLLASRATQNVILTEIKRPSSPLVGPPYRGVFMPSNELSGSVVQVLGYRDALQKDFYSLAANSGSVRFEAFDPRALLVIGDLESKPLSADQRRSFDLFRNGLKDVIVITFDELFNNIADLLAMTRDHGD
ncbi:Shedu immune nuclease family protein [Sphingopyxis sp.]|uniref:Shedu immune nuclease family protein n=1 Tax=Sphingopyxis sp. TaxID=1908224 RepID=UPI0025DFB4C8|nr:Shedu immune nuclease family protein [Sphingopyxis sp.]MBR2172520.1 DUF4263 domain-containing protein [Sphingopyxis sp.]